MRHLDGALHHPADDLLRLFFAKTKRAIAQCASLFENWLLLFQRWTALNLKEHAGVNRVAQTMAFSQALFQSPVS